MGQGLLKSVLISFQTVAFSALRVLDKLYAGVVLKWLKQKQKYLAILLLFWYLYELHVNTAHVKQ